jgi:hypothetical protein
MNRVYRNDKVEPTYEKQWANDIYGAQIALQHPLMSSGPYDSQWVWLEATRTVVNSTQ